MAVNPAPLRREDAGESLLSSSTVKLYGRKFTGLQLTQNLGVAPGGAGPLAALLQKAEIRDADHGSSYTLARIYGFFYLGRFHDTPSLPIMLVPASSEIPSQEAAFALGVAGAVDQLLVWEVDSLDAAVRIDLHVGWLKDLLLDAPERSDASEPPCNHPPEPGGAGISTKPKRRVVGFTTFGISVVRPGRGPP